MSERSIVCIIHNQSSQTLLFDRIDRREEGQSHPDALYPGVTNQVNIWSDDVFYGCECWFYYSISPRGYNLGWIKLHLDNPWIGHNHCSLELDGGAQNLLKVSPAGSQEPGGNNTSITFTLTDA